MIVKPWLMELAWQNTPGIGLTVIYFRVEPDVISEVVRIDTENNNPAKVSSADDDQFLAKFKEMNSAGSSISFEDVMVRNAQETMAAIGKYSRCNLFLFGRAPEGEVALSLNRSECPELGPVGNLLISPDFATTASVLVVQQYYNESSFNFSEQMEDLASDED